MATKYKTPKRTKITIPGSTSNIGTGFDAFSIALNLHIKVEWEPAAKTSVERKGRLISSTLPLGKDPVLRGMRRASMIAGRRLPPGKIVVDADFPPGRGLGASGAGIAAGLLIGNQLTGEKIERSRLLDEAISLEGHPENATAAFLGGAHWSAKKINATWIHHPIQIHKSLRFLLVIPPYPLSTKRSRDILPSSVSFKRATSQARRSPLLIEGLRLLDKELIRIGIKDELHVGSRMRLLTGASSVIEFAKRHNAIGATLSGAGSALLIITQTGEVKKLEAKMTRHVKRLWGESGQIIATRLSSGMKAG